MVERHGQSLTAAQDVAILQHGLSSTRDGSFLPELAAALAGAGISSFRFDFSANGKSEGTFKYGNYHAEARPAWTNPSRLLLSANSHHSPVHWM